MSTAANALSTGLELSAVATRSYRARTVRSLGAVQLRAPAPSTAPPPAGNEGGRPGRARVPPTRRRARHAREQPTEPRRPACPAWSGPASRRGVAAPFWGGGVTDGGDAGVRSRGVALRGGGAR